MANQVIYTANTFVASDGTSTTAIINLNTQPATGPTGTLKSQGINPLAITGITVNVVWGPNYTQVTTTATIAGGIISLNFTDPTQLAPASMYYFVYMTLYF